MYKTSISILAIAIVLVGAGNLYAAHTDHGCSNCHVPHKAGNPADPTVHGVPLWSNAQNADGLPLFTLYSSISFDALLTDIGQPDGATKLCLGCHDGSYEVFVNFLPDSAAIFKPEDLARTHPVSFTYDAILAGKVANGALRDPTVALSGFGGTIAQDLLDDQSKMQCSSCHDVHLSGLTVNLLRWDLDVIHDQDMCRVCHNK